MAKTFQKALSVLLAALCVLGCLAVPVFATESEAEVEEPVNEKSKSSVAIAAARELLDALQYEDYVARYSNEELYPRATAPISVNVFDYIKDQSTATIREVELDGVKGIETGSSGMVVYKVDIPKTAKYSVKVKYTTLDETPGCSTIQRSFRVNGVVPFKEAYTVSFTKNWGVRYDPAYKSTTKQGDIRLFKTDVDNNEIRAGSYLIPAWSEYSLRDVDGFFKEPFEIVFEAGVNYISFDAIAELFTIAEITLYPCEELISYADFIAAYASAPKGTGKVKFEAEYPYRTSTNTIYPIEDRASAATSPCDTHRVLLNTLGGEKWETSQQWISYQFTVDADGLYEIVARFRQNINDGMYSSRVLYLYSDDSVKSGEKGYYDGIPFDEARELRFNYSENWQVSPLCFGTVSKDGEGYSSIEYTDCEFYFKAGVTYTMKLEIALGTMGEIVSSVQNSMEIINNAYLNIMKLTGSSPDSSRDYSFSAVMPDTVISLIRQSAKVQEIADQLTAFAGIKSSNVSTLEKIARLLKKMGSDPEAEIAKNLSELKTYIGNLGTWLSNAKIQPLQFDYIVVQSSEEKLPVANPSFFKTFLHEMSSFIQSFFRNYNRMGATEENLNSKDAVQVWNAFGRDQAQVIRNLINNNFSPYSGITVDLKLISGGTLLPSILAGVGPDCYIGIGDDTIINYAIRGAIVNIEDFDGFRDLLYYRVDDNFNTVYDETGTPIKNPNAQFNEAAMLVLGIADAQEKMHYYGLPDTQSFPMMFIRTDILADLGIKSLDTWSELLETATVLAQNSMTIGLTTSYNIYLYQMGGTQFADGGMRINLDSNLALDCMETMCNMFTMYSFPYSYNFVNRFRTGEMPIGIAGYNGTYNHLVVFATEIRGMWEFVPAPGMERTDAEGNTYINNNVISSISALIIPSGAKSVEDAWSFMKWYVGKDFQVDYSNEMIAILGDSAKHATANLEALTTMPWTNKERSNLMAQFENLASIPNYPGAYIIGRYTHFTFLAAYNDKADPVTKMLSYINIINKEITRKRAEFGLETLEIGQTLASKRRDMVVAELDALSEADKSAYSSQIAAVRKAIGDIDEFGTWKAYCEDKYIDALAAAGQALKAADPQLFEKVATYIETIASCLREYQISYPLEFKFDF